MKYEGKRKSGSDADVYSFAMGKGELEILFTTVQRLYENTPPLFELMQFRGRLRSITKELGKVYVEEIKGKKLPAEGGRVQSALARHAKSSKEK